jgi:uncharacterized protein (TIGR00251 family)
MSHSSHRAPGTDNSPPEGEDVIEATSDRAGGTLLAVMARPRSRRPGVVGTRCGAVVVAIAAAPEKGKANAAILEILADLLGIAKSRLDLVSGATARSKMVRIAGLEPDQVRQAIYNHLKRSTLNDQGRLWE